MKTFLAAVALLAALLSAHDASAEGAPVLTLLFSANSYGSVRPCPS